MGKYALGFQIHLSTALVIMFTACLLAWANVEGEHGRFVIEGPSNVNQGNVVVSDIYGWPFLTEHQTEAEVAKYNGFADWIVPPIVTAFLNFWFGLGVLTLVGLACEWCLRRRELEKKP